MYENNTQKKNTNMYFQDGIDDDFLKTFQVSNSCDPFWGVYIYIMGIIGYNDQFLMFG